MLTRIFQVDVHAVCSGAVGVVQGGVKTGDADDAVLSGIGAGLNNAVLLELPTAVTTGIAEQRNTFVCRLSISAI
jgi:hypothetical protein